MLQHVTPDHVAVAVPALDPAMPRWADQLGGRTSGWFSNGVFRSRQLRYPNGMKVELIAPHERDAAPDNFVRAFLGRFGASVHHVTLKVPDLRTAITQAQQSGFDVVDVDMSDAIWKEAFLRPSQVGGIIVQLAQNDESDEVWARRIGCDFEEPAADAARPLGPVVASTDLDTSRLVWERLGGEVWSTDQGLVVSWPTGPLEVRLVAGERAGGRSIAVVGDTVLPEDPVLGAAITPAVQA